jgi:hypothetical protein
MGSLTVSLTPSLNPKTTLLKFLRHVTRRVSVYFFILSSYYFDILSSHFCLYFICRTSAHRYHTFFIKNPQKNVFFCPTLEFSRRLF